MILDAVLTLGGLGFIFAAGLGIAGRVFSVKEDPTKRKILNILPRANCGACGFAGCSNYADLLVQGQAEINLCPVGKQEVVDKISAILGKEIARLEKKVAVIKCTAGDNECGKRFVYQGVKSCRAAVLVSGGNKGCEYGCLGFNDCATVCPFDAIVTISGKPPVVNGSKCTGCGICVKECPKNIIELVSEKSTVQILCSSLDKGKDTRSICKAGCFACNLCVKNCPENAITIVNNLAVIDFEKCNNCGKCVEKCPVKCIRQGRGDKVFVAAG
ncbi:MAG: RnfABCDGE type electron transport complex subunit B [Elusimicrobiota bacterium]